MEATREILWNVHGIGNGIALYGLLVVALAIAVVGIYRHAEIWLSGTSPHEPQLPLFARFLDLYSWGLLQQGVVRRRAPAIAHTLVYLGFLVLLFTTTMVFVDHDLGIRIYKGNFYLAVTILSDCFGVALLAGCMLFARRRYLERPDLLHTRASDHFLLILLGLLVVQGYLLEGLRIHATQDPWAAYSPIGFLVSEFFWAISAKSAARLHFVIWWFHTLTVYSAIAVVPYTKLFHIVASSLNVFLRRRSRPKGALESPGDLEKLVEAGDEFTIGLGSIKDYSWRHLMDLDACTSCGRCQDACPAYLSGKPLSPKWVVLDTRNHMLALQTEDKVTPSHVLEPLRTLDKFLMKELLLKNSGLTRTTQENGSSAFTYIDGGSFRAGNSLVQEATQEVGGDPTALISGGVINPDTFWSCTTCFACVEACPVGINHVDQIIGNRRNMVLMQGSVPSEAQKTLRALENRANPYGPAENRTAWLGDLQVPIVEAGAHVDYLYWVGCVSAYDARKQKIARALVKIMQRAGLNFGILGNAEGCSGDPARRLGEENLYQTLAKGNLETLKSVRFKTLVANCPHCFNTIKNEYPQFGNLGDGQSPEIIHHSVLLRRLLREQKLTLIEGESEEFTFHDPCYLGRYNDEYDAPRETLTANKSLKIVEMERSREGGMCCGAGGGHFWMDLKIGTRINTLRVDQAAATGAKKIATACPFCMQMMEDGVKLTNREGQIEVRDIAEVIAEKLA